MPSFQSMFVESKGKPITYKGKALVIEDVFPVRDGERLRFVFESVGSEWKQGVMLRTNYGLRTKGWFIREDGEKFKSPIVIWRHEAPDIFEFTIRTKNNELDVWNVWDHGDGMTQSRHYGAAMIVEELPNGRRYRCNDGHPDEDFDDIIFRIERVDVNQ